MHMEKETYKRYVDARAPHSPIGRDCIFAFVSGGLICTLGQALRNLYEGVCKIPEEDAGTLVPITGFANAVVSPAIDSHAEGLILGVGAKIFTVAGPVLLYGTLAGSVFGLIYWIFGLF